MIKQVTLSLAMTSALVSFGTYAHVQNGALTDGNNKAISSSYGKCITVSTGRFFSQCQDIKPKVLPPAPVRVAAPAPAPVVAPAPVAVAATVSLAGDATFANNSSDITASGKASLDQLIRDYDKVDVTSVDLVGHADSRGDADYNQGLSERRAESIKTYLVEQGANPAKLTTSGRGESDPVASNSTKEGRAQNRRVDIKIVGTQKSN
jgi:OOP family OmpA-OmpF porin